jgi:hypothetical protein
MRASSTCACGHIDLLYNRCSTYISNGMPDLYWQERKQQTS